MKVYISGKITGNPNYREQFKEAELYLTLKGYKVFNPCCIPDIFSYDEFMKIDLTALSCCDAIYMLRNWKDSKGACIEYNHAVKEGKTIMYEE